MDYFYKKHLIPKVQKERLYMDMVIDGIMNRDSRYTSRENVFDMIFHAHHIHYDWLRLKEDIDSFFEYQKEITETMKHIKPF